LDSYTIVKEAESWLGTPWKHGVSLKGWGTDCVQFMMSIAKNCDLISSESETIKYTKDWALHNSRSLLLEGITDYCYRIDLRELNVGDLIIFHYGQTASHIGMYIGNNEIIHSQIRHGVMKTKLDTLVDKIVSVWRFNNCLT
jgi:NlpC/P60 family putative phage cell wall peptidase